jgi:adenylate kinase
MIDPEARTGMSYLLTVSLLLATGVAGQALVTGPVIIFIGPPASGKSTQAKMAAESLKLPVISAEDLIASNPAAFKKINPPGITGMEPRTDPALNELFGARLATGKYRDGVIVDGYPATKDHGDYMRSLVEAGRLPNPTILQLDISDDELRKRAGKNADAKFEQLLKDYHRETDMITIYFPSAKIIRVDATGKPDKVRKRVEDTLLPLLPAQKRS